MMRCSLLSANIDKIGLCTASLEVLFHHLVLHIGSKHCNKPRNVLYTEKLVIGQVITLDKNETTQKKSLVTTTPNIRHN